MKRLIAALIALLVVASLFTLVSCGGDESSNPTTTPAAETTPAETTTVTQTATSTPTGLGIGDSGQAAIVGWDD